MSTSQLNKLKSGTKNGIQVTLNLSSNEIGNSNGETNFLHRLLLTDTKLSRLCKVFANDSSANTNLSKTQLSKISQLRRFLPLPLIFLALKIGEKVVKHKVSILANNGAKTHQNSL